MSHGLMHTHIPAVISSFFGLAIFVVYKFFSSFFQAVPDTKLTLKKYSDAKFEFLVRARTSPPYLSYVYSMGQ